MSDQEEHRNAAAELWPIIHFKRWILREQLADVTACAGEVVSLLALSDNDPEYIYHLALGAADGYEFDYADPKHGRAAELWGRLVEARLFVEDAVNNVLEATVYIEDDGGDEDAFLYDDFELHARTWPFERNWKLQVCILRLQLDRWVNDYTRHLYVWKETLVEYEARVRNERVDIGALLDLADELLRFHRFFLSVDGMTLMDPAPQMVSYKLKNVIEEVLQMSARIVTCASNHSAGQWADVSRDQQRRLLKHIFWRHSLMSEQNLVHLLVRTVPSNCSALLEEVSEVAFVLDATKNTLLMSYLLENQRALFDTLPPPFIYGTTTMFTVIRNYTGQEFHRGGPNALPLLRRHMFRFHPDLDTAYYHCAFVDGELMFEYWRQPAFFNDSILTMVELGMPVAVRRFQELPLHFTAVPATRERTLCTSLENLLLAAAKSRMGSSDLSEVSGQDLVDPYRSYPQSTRAAVLRFLIAERSPVPKPQVLGVLLKSCKLTPLFTTLYCLFRAGKRVVLPEIDSERHMLPWNRPAHYRKLAVIIRELLQRCGTDYPQSFLGELDRIAGCEVRRQVDTLQMSALRVVRRHLSPSAAPSSHPRLTLDNYQDLTSLPTFGELHFTKPPHLLIPTTCLSLLNLTDLMTAYRDIVAANGAVNFVDLAA